MKRFLAAILALSFGMVACPDKKADDSAKAPEQSEKADDGKAKDKGKK